MGITLLHIPITSMSFRVISPFLIFADLAVCIVDLTCYCNFFIFCLLYTLDKCQISCRFTVHFKGNSHSCNTVNIILPGFRINQWWTTLSVQVKSYSNSTAWMLFKTTHLIEFKYYVFRHPQWNPGSQPQEDGDWVNNAQLLRLLLRGQTNSKI